MTRQIMLDPEDFEEARQVRDPRFDGRFFVGVITTGIYCRPVCPVPIPRKENIQLYKSAAAAAAAGFRPCLRCRPEASPGTPAWSGSSWKVSRALQLIDQGFLNEASVRDLAGQLGIGCRQLSRLFQDHLGASPLAVARTRRLHFAKQLIDETKLKFSEVCFAAGFGSVRRFNAEFSNVYGCSPKQLRDKRRRQPARKPTGSEFELSLSFRPPYDWSALLGYLAYRAIPGVEIVTENSYARTFEMDGEQGHAQALFSDNSNTVRLNICFSRTRHLQCIVDRFRSVLDLRADSNRIDSFLASDDLLRPRVEKFPGLRVPGCWSGFEVAVRAILGQQITVKAASTLAARLTARHGRLYQVKTGPGGLTAGGEDIEGLEYTFPEPQQLADADLSGLGIVGQRVEAVKTVASMLCEDQLRIDSSVETAEFVDTICTVKGIGEWTAQYIAMRALNDPNAFPHSDLILRRATARNGEILSPKQLLYKAKPWQPWRAYAVMYLWRGFQMQKLSATEPGSSN